MFSEVKMIHITILIVLVLFILLIFVGYRHHANTHEAKESSSPNSLSEVTIRTSKNDFYTPATAIDSGFYGSDGSYEPSFWIDEIDLDFNSVSTSSERFFIRIDPRGEQVHDIVLSTFSLDSKMQPTNENTITCKEGEIPSGNTCEIHKNNEDGYIEIVFGNIKKTRASL